LGVVVKSLLDKLLLKDHSDPMRAHKTRIPFLELIKSARIATIAGMGDGNVKVSNLRGRMMIGKAARAASEGPMMCVSSANGAQVGSSCSKRTYHQLGSEYIVAFSSL
jgi:hypothetical protein